MASTQTTRRVCIFIDSSVLFAAALSARENARDLVLLRAKAHIELSWSSFVLAETRRNLEVKAPHALTALAEFQVAGIVSEANPTLESIREIAKVIEPKDAAIVAGALTANASYLASYDRKHLLSQASIIQSKFQILVETPEAILLLLSDIK